MTTNTEPGSNPDRVRADQERRRSGAAGTHLDRRTKRRRSRADRERAARKEASE